MIVKQQLLNNFPNTINKTAPVFSSMVANSDNTGMLEKQLNDILNYMKEWVDTYNLYEQSDELLMKTVNFISFIKKFTDENDGSIKNRIKSIFIRKGDTKWGTVENIKNVFKQYAATANVYVLENSLDFNSSSNLIQGGDFTDLEQTEWTLNDNAIMTSKASFSGSFGIELGTKGQISQKLYNVEPGTYYLHYMGNGPVNPCVHDRTNSCYWYEDSESWQSDFRTITHNSTEWQQRTIWFYVPEKTTIGIYFYNWNTTKVGYVDYIRLIKKPIHPCFTVLLHYSGELTGKELALAPGTNDPITRVEEDEIPSYYNGYGYFDQAFLTGAGSGSSITVFQELLELVRPVGVQANFELVKRETN